MLSDSDEKYLPTTLPKKVTRDIYVMYDIAGYRSGEISIWDCDVSGKDRVLLTAQEVTFKIPSVDMKTKVIEALESEKNKVIAEAHMKAKELQEKIDSLLALEYHPSEAI